MEIDQELAKLGLKQITNFQYNVRDYLFDVVSFFKKYSLTSNLIE